MLRFYRGSNVEYLGEDEKRTVVVFFDFFVVVSAALVLVVGFSRVRCLFACFWLGYRSRGDGGRASCWLLESAACQVAFHGV